jgi:tetratricopeptide (TPR) repeat protein
VDAQKSYQKVLAIEADNEDALTGLALVYSDLGDNRKAAELLKRLAEKNPSARSLTALAAAYEQMRDFKSAAGALRQLLETNPANDREVKRNLAQDLMLSQDYAAALGIYNGLVADDPADAQSYLRISQIYRQQKDFQKAREASDKAKAAEPNSIEIRYNEVNILEAEDRVPDATKLLKGILDSTAKKSYNQAERANRVALLERLAGCTVPSIRSIRRSMLIVRWPVDPLRASRSSAQVIDAHRAAKDFPKAQQEADAAVKSGPTIA